MDPLPLPPYGPVEHRTRTVQDLFDRIAPRYDLINDLQSFGLHRYWKHRMVSQGGRGLRALDLCTGTGDIATRLATRMDSVAGLDFSGPMIEKARRRARRWPNLLLVRGDARQIPFLDGSFDLVSIAYGLRNLSSVESGLSEMWRVTRPGGRILILDFSKPDHRLWRQIYYFYLKRVVPLFGWLFHGDSQTYGYIFQSLENYPSAETLRQKLLKLEAGEVQVQQFLGGIMALHCARKPIDLGNSIG